MNDIAYHKNNSKTLLIWFGGINEPFISEKLGLQCNVDLVAVTDKFNSWYTAGFRDGHETYLDALNDLSKIITDGSYEKLVLCGQSSGGYGALRFSLDLSPDFVIAFSPQTRNAFSGQCQMCPHVKLDDLGDLYKDHKKTKLTFILSRSELDHETAFRWNDKWQVAKFRSHQKATFIDLPYDNHSVSVKIKEQMNLYKFIHGLLVMNDAL